MVPKSSPTGQDQGARQGEGGYTREEGGRGHRSRRVRLAGAERTRRGSAESEADKGGWDAPSCAVPGQGGSLESS